MDKLVEIGWIHLGNDEHSLGFQSFPRISAKAGRSNLIVLMLCGKMAAAPSRLLGLCSLLIPTLISQVDTTVLTNWLKAHATLQ